ncbi:MAG: hypothetical protein IPJ32_06915 [Sphingobacteriaceae bacterium]|nr:hypothetical protein [Sphingobacteriaceae bacterium]
MNTGIGLVYNNKNWFVKLGSNSLQGYILPKQTYGQGAYFSIAKNLIRMKSIYYSCYFLLTFT